MDDKISSIEKRILSEEHSSQKILGVFIIASAILNIIEAAVKVFLRIRLAEQFDLLDKLQTYIAVTKLFAIVLLFFLCLHKMTRLYFHSPYVRKLLYIWGIILIPFQIVFEITTDMYNRMLGLVWLLLNDSYDVQNDALYSLFYDSTHGFKYLGMFLVMTIGIIATGIILEKKELIVCCIIITALFIFSFVAVSMKTVNISSLSMSIGLNFTSLIFHGLMTLGLLGLGVYVFRTYDIKKIEL